MKLFGFTKKDKETKFKITEPDRNWVEDNFKWLIQAYGYPNRKREQILINDKYFPKSVSIDGFKVQNLIEDLSDLLEIDSKKVKYELHEDLRDLYGIPFEVQGKPFETELEVNESFYILHIAKSISERPNRLVFNLIHEFIKIRLTENNLQFDTGEDTGLFLYIAAVYLGFGVILSQNLTDTGRFNDGFWETNWNYVSEIPNEVLAFSLATYSMLIGQDNPEWKSELPQELKLQFESAIIFLNDSPSKLFNKAELDARELFNRANLEYQNSDFDSAISTLQKTLFLTEDELLKASIYNNIGYYQLRKGDYEKGILNLKKALKIDSDYGFVYDNLGYAFIKIGQIEEGKKYLEKALQTENNDNAYTHRNFALYYLAKKEIEKAELNFQLAFEHETVSVDLLEFYYGSFLIDQGKTETGMEYLRMAVKKGEPEAIKRMNEIEKD